jgi:hypothetical protein
MNQPSNPPPSPDNREIIRQFIEWLQTQPFSTEMHELGSAPPLLFLPQFQTPGIAIRVSHISEDPDYNNNVDLWLPFEGEKGSCLVSSEPTDSYETHRMEMSLENLKKLVLAEKEP